MSKRKASAAGPNTGTGTEAAPSPTSPEGLAKLRDQLLGDKGRLEQELQTIHTRAQAIVGDLNKIVGAIGAIDHISPQPQGAAPAG